MSRNALKRRERARLKWWASLLSDNALGEMDELFIIRHTIKGDRSIESRHSVKSDGRNSFRHSKDKEYLNAGANVYSTASGGFVNARCRMKKKANR